MLRKSLISALFFVACGAAPSGTDGGTADAGTNPQPLTSIQFKAKVASADFACGQTYTLGSTATAYQPRDFRFYVHDVALLRLDGTRVPFVLADDGKWQNQGVALLDFEDASGGCGNGTAELNVALKGTIDTAHHYNTVEFTLGVPFEQNHQDATAAAAPLNLSGMFWNWQGGYKFLRIDGATTGQPMGHNIHLGSTACMPGSTPNSVAMCGNPNRVRVSLPAFTLGTSTVVVDLAALVVDSNLDADTMGAPGCMSMPDDVECGPLFKNLGLPFGGVPAGPQTVFRVE